MVAIWIVCAIHALWGLSMLLLGDPPRPFGSFEPYLAIFTPKEFGALLLTGALIIPGWFLAWQRWPALLLNRYAMFVSPLVIIPQQAIVLYGPYRSIVELITEFDLRLWYGLCYLSVLAFAHTWGLIITYRAAFRESGHVE
jgi:hypothetical protein